MPRRRAVAAARNEAALVVEGGDQYRRAAIPGLPVHIAFGFITYAVLKLTTGRAREVKPVVWAIAAVFVFRFAWLD